MLVSVGTIDGISLGDVDAIELGGALGTFDDTAVGSWLSDGELEGALEEQKGALMQLFSVPL